MIKFNVWDEDTPRSSARILERKTSWSAAEAFARTDPNPHRFDEEALEVRLLVEHPEGRIERIKVTREVSVEFVGYPDPLVGEIKICVQDEGFFWSLEPIRPKLSLVKGPVQSHGPFESWELAWQDANKPERSRL